MKSIGESARANLFAENMDFRLKKTLHFSADFDLFMKQVRVWKNAKSKYSDANEQKRRKVNMERKSMEKYRLNYCVRRHRTMVNVTGDGTYAHFHAPIRDRLENKSRSGYVLFRLDEHYFPHIPISIHSQFWTHNIFRFFFFVKCPPIWLNVWSSLNSQFIGSPVLREIAYLFHSRFLRNQN